MRKPRKPEKKPVQRGRPMLFRDAFDQLWSMLFSSPIHLDSALSKAPPSQKSALAEMALLLLQRPSSLAHYLRFQLSEGEPWEYNQEELANWRTARAMGHRLFQNWSRDATFAEAGFPHESDFPPFMVEEWKRDFGDKVARELIDTLGRKAPLSLRAARKKGRDTVLSALNDSKEIPIRAKASTVSPLGFYFPEYAAVLGHKLFKEGAYEIQDEGSQVMALFALWPEIFLPMLRKVPGKCREWPHDRELPVSKNITVVDACAGAGGKTVAMADALLGRGQVFAYDVSAKKLEAVRKRAKRMGLTNIKVAPITDSEAEVPKKFQGSADVVLVDAPCSGWGVLRRNPDVKWRQKSEDLARLEALQLTLLDRYSTLVKAGGTLTYGVCTFRKAETSNQIEKFLKQHPDFESIGGGYFGPGPSDGFYFHALRKKKETK
jgi:16S rRNA C967 or C1407 C5-methylase (RsmB/RsmF family)